MSRVHILLGITVLALLSACSAAAPADTQPVDRSDKIGNEAMAITEIKDEVLAEVLMNRVGALEKRIGEMEATRQTLELELLDARLRTVEAKVLAGNNVIEGREVEKAD